jgi:hypothetical protein
MRTAARLSALAIGASVAAMLASAALADAVSDAKAFMEVASKPNPPWNGPTSGPKAEAGKTIVYVSTDQRNGGARGAGEGVEEAAGKIGWTFRLIDGQGSVSGRSSVPRPCPGRRSGGRSSRSFRRLPARLRRRRARRRYADPSRHRRGSCRPRPSGRRTGRPTADWACWPRP